MSKAELKDHEAREAIRSRLDLNLLVEAGAGSGKTESLASRMVETVATGAAEVGELAAVTFTKKAASELRGRFRQELERRIAAEADVDRKDRLVRAMTDMERMFAGTIHSFCASLLRERPVEAGLAPGFREIEGQEDALLRRRLWREYVDRARASGDREFLNLVAAEIKPAELDAAFAVMCAQPDAEFPAGDSAIPNPGPAWEELDRFWEQLEQRCPEIRPNTTCRAQKKLLELRPRYRNASRSRIPILVQLLAHWETPPKIVQKWWNGAGQEVKQLVEEFALTTAKPFVSAWREYVYRTAVTLLADARNCAERERRRSAVLNFTDLLLYSSRLLRENRQVREALQRKYTLIFVDEFQDTDPMQAELLFLLAAEPGAGSDWTKVQLRPGSLFLVGDPKQSIYRFRRADIEIYQQALQRIEETGGKTIRLTTCFRSGSDICDWANSLFASLFPAEPTEQAPAFARLDAGGENPDTWPGVHRQAIPASIEQKAVRAEDARRIARFIRAAVDSGTRKWGDFLILTRKKAGRLGTYTEALEAARVPYEASGAGGLLESAFVQTLLALVMTLTRPDDEAAVVGALRGAAFGVSDPELYAYHKAGRRFGLSAPVPVQEPGPVAEAIRNLQKWRKLLRESPAVAALTLILEESGLLAKAAAHSGGGAEAGKLLYALDSLRAACESGRSLADAAAELEESGEDDDSEVPVLDPGRKDVVRIMNLHKAKGLEGRVVLLADPLGGVTPRVNIRVLRAEGKTRGYFAITRPKGSHGNTETLGLPAGWESLGAEEEAFLRAEETRLLYVAATRARQTLIVSGWDGAARGSVVRPWKSLSEAIPQTGVLPEPPAPPERVPVIPDLSAAARNSARQMRVLEREQVTKPRYSVFAVSTYAASAARDGWEETDSPAGSDWGSLIHALLERAVADLDCSREELEAVARWHLQQAAPGLLEAIPQAVTTVEAVRSSPFWADVRRATKRISEIPLAGLEESASAVVARGIIDLAYELDDGWHIVDYKTDTLRMPQLEAQYGPQVRAYSTMWERITGSKVGYAGIFSVRSLSLSADVRLLVETAR